MKKIFIGSFLFTVFLYVGMTEQVWSVMEAWQRALWVLFMFVGQGTLMIIPILYLLGYRPINLKKEMSDMKVGYVTEQLKNELLLQNTRRMKNDIRNLQTENSVYRDYIGLDD